MKKEWYEMKDVLSPLSNEVWIPLRSMEILRSDGNYGCEGYLKEILGVGSVMMPISSHKHALRLAWNDIGFPNRFVGGVETIHDRTNENTSDGSGESQNVTKYLPCGYYWDYRSGKRGVGLVIEQDISSQESPIWHLHQDFVVALNLRKKEDEWVRPTEECITVARLNRNEENKPERLEVRAEHLCDYLRAREMNLYIATYRSRSEIVADTSHIDWKNNRQTAGDNMSRWEGQIQVIPGSGLTRISGELWSNEVVYAGNISQRVLQQRPPSSMSYIANRSGQKKTRELLEHEILWLWFRPEVVKVILGRQGGFLHWLTHDTGTIGLAESRGVHFGVDKRGKINVFAKDIVLLPESHQLVWVGFNITPEGNVSHELLASQHNAMPASTVAPEVGLKQAYGSLNNAVNNLAGKPLFCQHAITEELFAECHRFRAINRNGLFELAKDMARLTIESVDKSALYYILDDSTCKDKGSINLLERAIQKFANDDMAMRMVASIRGLNKLRQADAHLPSGDLSRSISKAGINETGNSIHEACQLLQAHSAALSEIAKVFSNS